MTVVCGDGTVTVTGTVSVYGMVYGDDGEAIQCDDDVRRQCVCDAIQAACDCDRREARCQCEMRCDRR